MIWLLQRIIKLYALIVSPFTGPSCRFHPTCSKYAHQALERHGASKGLFLAVKRLSKCHPWGKNHDFTDPVPETFDWPRVIRYKRRANKNS